MVAVPKMDGEAAGQEVSWGDTEEAIDTDSAAELDRSRLSDGGEEGDAPLPGDRELNKEAEGC